MFFPGETASFCLVFLCTKQIPDNTGPAQVGEESEITGAKSSIGVITTSNLSETWVRNRGTLPETRQLDDAGTTAKKKPTDSEEDFSFWILRLRKYLIWSGFFFFGKFLLWRLLYEFDNLNPGW